MFSFISKQQKKDNKQGFTLIELLMVMALLFIMAYISMANYNRFGREVELENAVYELALTIRQAQFFGINRSEQFGSTFDDPQPYGVYFNLDGNEEQVDDASFMMFIDQNIDRVFDVTDNTYAPGDLCEENFSGECIRTYEFTRSNYISDICVGADELNCDSLPNIGSGEQELHISFKRPDPDAVIRRNLVSPPYSYARITLSSPIADVATKSVSVGAAGLISID